ncbi:MAG: SagB/ThcOx family dehydrogenase [Candidatus Bathyarchaeia archaeon]|jgi:SagB-type dehydrogenase family enzyme
MSKTTGDDFQIETKYTRHNILGGNLDWRNKPETYKSYPGSKTVQLPDQLKEATLNFAEVLTRRKSIRAFSTQPLTRAELGFLLWASTGIQRIEHGYEFRTAPSAGALYPIETYIAANNVENVDCGIYHYNIKNHQLEELKTGSFGADLAHAALDQEMCATASAVFIWTAVFRRSKWKYKQRAYRYIYLDAGHVAENLALATASINCGSCQVGAFFDDEINSIVVIDGTEESAICLSVVGHSK